MSFRFSLPRLSASFALAVLASPAAHAQYNVADEVKALRQMVEQQAKQIELLTAQVSRLSAKMDGGAGAAPATPAAPAENTEFAVPAARPVPPRPPANVHIVVKGESLEKIAKAHGTTTTELQKLNRITDPKKLQIGQQLVLPPPTPKKEGQ